MIAKSWLSITEAIVQNAALTLGYPGERQPVVSPRKLPYFSEQLETGPAIIRWRRER
jgi:hypothetical protein